MRRIFLLFLLLGFIVTNSIAQDESTYRFFYIAQSGLSQKQKIIDALVSRYDDAKEQNINCVFYLANVDQPQIVTVKENYDKFENFLSLIQNSNGYDVRPSTDAEMIIDYLQTNPFFDNDGNVKSQYDRVNFVFYVNSEFWNTDGNRDLIAALYNALDVANQENIVFNIFMSKRDGEEGKLIYDEVYPFTEIAPRKLNEEFIGITRY